VIAPVVPPSPGTDRTAVHAAAVSMARKPLPLPDLPPQRASAVVYGTSAVDDRGRVADRAGPCCTCWVGPGDDASTSASRVAPSSSLLDEARVQHPMTRHGGEPE
jgi:hypothetical protein